jgi:hypothetical protein
MIKVYLNRKVSETQITIGNQYESGVNAIDFDLSELKQKWPNGNIYLLVSRKKHTWPYSIDDGEFKIEYVLTWKRGFYQMNVVVTDEKITDQLESSNTIFVSDTINAYVNENQINAKALNEQELPRELQIVYDDLITLKKNIEKDLADGKYIGPQGPKGEPGDVTEEYRNLASQIAQNASDAQASATNAQVSATNAQKALDDTKDFVNQTKTELNQIKTDTRVLKDEANTSAVNAKASEDKAKEYADHLKENTDAISQNTKAINELNDKKITKFYASNQGETHVTDSDKGLIQNLKIYGQSKQDGEPSPSNPVEIKNVVNPKMSVCGSNILQKDKKYIKQTKFGGNVTLNDDESLSYDGSILNAYATAYIQELTLKKGTYQLLANQYSSSNDIGAKLIIEKASGYLYALNNTPFTIDVDDTNCRLFISSEDEANYPLAVSGTVRCALVYSGSTTDIQPYIGKSVNLPITLNAIPVSSGGNVTINGQQYISDYVDVERSKLVKCVSKKTLNGTELYDHPKHWNDNAFVINDFIDNGILYEDYNAIADIISDKLVKTSPSAIADRGTIGIGLAFKKAYICLGDGYNTAEKIKEYFSSNNTEVYYVLNTPTETDLTIEQAQSLKELATYYPITNISVNSEQLEGYTVFNYPISLANGWNYVKKQLNDNRDYIYDMDLQSAEAYVNSEYAVTLTELEV